MIRTLVPQAYQPLALALFVAAFVIYAAYPQLAKLARRILLAGLRCPACGEPFADHCSSIDDDSQKGI